ncbi:MAG: hypothetical protein ACLQU2_37210 [Candidatus Binataceae bacterium]
METESKIAKRVRPTVLVCQIKPPIRGSALLLLFALLVAWIAPAGAVDGVLEINQTVVSAAGGFPYQITAAGSYRLTGNLVVGVADTNAINVTASPVTIDLNGFSISGAGGSVSSGIQDNVGQLTVKNGTIQSFGEGVNSAGPDVIADLTTNNTSQGIFVSNAVVRRYTAESTVNGVGCGGFGTCVVADSLINASTTGINIFDSTGSVTNCVVTSAGVGISILQGSGSVIGNTINMTAGSATSTAVSISTLAGPSGYGANTANVPAGATCFAGGTSMGTNVCNGTVQ